MTLPRGLERVVELLAAALGTGAFWTLAPPTVLPGPEVDTFALSRMSMLVVGGLAYLTGVLAWRSFRRAPLARQRIFLGCVLALGLMGVGFAVQYSNLRGDLLVPYGDLKVIRDDALTPRAHALREHDGHVATNAALLMAFAGSVEEVWTAESVREARNRMWLAFVPALLFSLFALTVTLRSLAEDAPSGKPSKPGKPGKPGNP